MRPRACRPRPPLTSPRVANRRVSPPPLPPLPAALPMTPCRDAARNLKAARDERFWPRAREIGIQAFFGLGGRHIITDDHLSILKSVGVNTDQQQRDLKWVEDTKTMLPQGNKMAAQHLLCFR